MYTAIVLNDASRTNLLNRAGNLIANLGDGFQAITQQGESLTHHATLNMGNLDANLNDPALLNSEVKFVIDSFAYDDKVAAFGVKSVGSTFGNPPVKTINAKPHVTAAINVSNGGKPFLSNKLTNWTPIAPVEVSGNLVVVN